MRDNSNTNMRNFELVLNVLEQLEPELRNRFTFPDLDERDRNEPEFVDGVIRSEFALPAPAVFLDDLVNSLGPLPDYSVIIGKCEDEIPFLMDLANPKPGSVLITGDSLCGKTRLLKSILASAGLLNSERLFNYHLITPILSEYDQLTQLSHPRSISTPFSQEANDIVVELCKIADQRRTGRFRDPAIILAIDDLASFIGNHTNDDILTHLLWLIRNGPKSMVWTFATIRTDYMNDVEPKILRAFGTRLIGYSDFPYSDRNIHLSDPSDLVPGSQFGVLFEGEWVRFDIPSL